jgi:quercetin dioxygenase-like cupin family protein
MTYVGDGETSAFVRPSDRIETIALRSSRVGLVAPGAVTDHRYGLFRFDMEPRSGGPDAHFHRTFSEAFFVLAGTVRLYDGREWVDGRPGDYLHVPDGGIHAFRNDSAETASMLILFAPGSPRERYFAELADIAATGRTLDRAEWTELYARHDQFMVDPSG